jgi:hypothetical protein
MQREGPPDDPVDQIEGGDMLEARLWEQTDPRIFSTNADDPDEGRTFIWTQTAWFERIEGEDADGPVEFSPLSMDEHALREWLSEQGLEIEELDDEYAANVREEFLNEEPLYPEAPELSNQELESQT